MTSTFYETAAAFAVTAENLADAIDDQRPDWPELAAEARALLDAIAPAPPGTPAALDVDAITARAAAATATPDAAWEFLAAARHDVLALAAEVGRLRRALAETCDNGTSEWACRQCSAAYFGTPPEDRTCPSCQPYGACQGSARP